MSRIAWFCGLIMAAAAPALADPATTRPVDPAPVVAAVSGPDVYLAPFHPLTDAPAWAWVGRAVQQNLSADLTRAAFGSTAGDTDADPLTAARSAGARYLVTGTYQWVEPHLRLTGQVREVTTGNAVGALSVTGGGRDLFGLEDELSAQLVRALTRTAGRPAARLTVPPALEPGAAAAAIAPPAAAVGSAYAGSALQAYVDNNRTPSVDYNQQLSNARQQNVFGSYNNYGGPDGSGYGGFGYGSFGGYGGGGYLPGVSYPIAAGGSLGYSGLGRGGAGLRGGFGFGGRGGFAGGFGSRGGFGGGRGFR